MVKNAPALHSDQYVTLFVASEEYAFPILRVREIIEYSRVTRIPATPPWITGVINLRGVVVPVFDLAAKFGLPQSPVTRLTCVVLVDVSLQAEQTIVGIIADSVNEVVDLTSEQIGPPPPFGTHASVDYLVGMGITEKGLLLLLDVDRVFSEQELNVAADAASMEVDTEDTQQQEIAS